MSYLIRRVLAKPRLILDEMCRLYGKFASYLRRVLCKTRLIFPRINGPKVTGASSKKIIIIISFITVFAGVLFVHQLGANHAPRASVIQVNHSVHTLSTFLRIRVDPSMKIF